MTAPATTARRYGQWAGNENGQPENPANCVVEVYPGNGTFIPHQCKRKRGQGYAGLYCTQHAKWKPVDWKEPTP